MMIKHIFSDMDGTLLNANGKIAAATVKAIKATKLPLTLVSARAPMEMAATIDALALKEPQIAFNGGLIFKRVDHEWRSISECALDTGVAASIIRALTFSFPTLSISYYDRDHWYTSRLDQGIEYEQRLTGQKAQVMPQSTVFAQPHLRVFKIMLITFDPMQMAAMQHMLTELAIPNISVQRSGTAYLEITSSDAKKSRGIDYILTQEQLHTEETAGFGDGHNDLPMLNMVGLPIVMGNALPEIKAVGKFVTKSNVENGVAYALNILPEFRA